MGLGELLGCFFPPGIILYLTIRYGVYSRGISCLPLHLCRNDMGSYLPIPKLPGEERYNALRLFHADICGYWIIYPPGISVYNRSNRRYSRYIQGY